MHLKTQAAVVVLLLAVFILFSCASDSVNDNPLALAKPASACAASRQWIADPSLPKDVAGDQSNCDFHRFMWQSFLYLVQPDESGSNVREFETFMPAYGVFVGPGETPAAWGSVPKPAYCQGVNPPDAGYLFSNLTLQAGSDLPLIDASLNDVFYGVSVNEAAYRFITGCDLYKAQCALTLAPDLLTPGGMAVVDIPAKYPALAFPDQAIELKTAWKILTDEEIASKTFYTTQGAVLSSGGDCRENVTLGLVGMHIISKTPTHPEFIWATFEHKNNAPDCTAPGAQPPLGGEWTFFDANCKGDCSTNEYVKGKTTQVCRMHPWGDPTVGVFPNNLNCDSVPPPGYICDPDVQDYIIKPNTENLKALNASVTAMLQGLPDDDPNRLWANYELVGNVWTIDGVLPPNLQTQRGSLSSANTTMETYVQNGEANVTNPNNCFSCHNLDGKTVISSPDQASRPVTLPPAGLAHIFNLLNTATTGCDDGKRLPATAACSVYYQ
jgi:hypothetical protein